VSAVTKTHCTIAVRTPMSRTRAARETNSRDSSAGRPNSLTSVAPGAEKRSVIWLPMAALWSAASRSSRASRRPIRRAGTTNTGSSTRASTVTCQDRVSMTPSASASVTTFPATPDSVSLNARCAPMTSLFSLLTSAPVRVRVKKATGMRWTCEKTVARRSRINPSPIRAENHRVTTPSPASATAMTAISTARPTTVPGGPWVSIVSITRPASTGVATASTAPTTLSTRNTASRRRCGRAKPAMRRSVERENGRVSSWACIAWYSEFHACISMLIREPRSARSVSWRQCRARHRQFRKRR
jgi:hypothetical protein